MRVRRYDTTQPRGSMQFCGSMKSRQEQVGSKEGKIEGVIHCMIRGYARCDDS